MKIVCGFAYFQFIRPKKWAKHKTTNETYLNWLNDNRLWLCMIISTRSLQKWHSWNNLMKIHFPCARKTIHTHYCCNYTMFANFENRLFVHWLSSISLLWVAQWPRISQFGYQLMLILKEKKLKKITFWQNVFFDKFEKEMEKNSENLMIEQAELGLLNLILLVLMPRETFYRDQKCGRSGLFGLTIQSHHPASDSSFNSVKTHRKIYAHFVFK